MATTSPETPPAGTLHIQGPHWTSILSVFDHRFLPVLQGVGEIEKSVPAGIYEVEASIGTSCDRRQVVVRPGQTGSIGPTEWNVALSTIAPVEGSTTSHEWHQGPAVSLSRQVTWNRTTGPSRLFLFARAIEPGKGADFQSGLRLADMQGKIVTDFTEGVERSDSDSWMAFTADLPAGGYRLGFARRGVRARWVPIWLSPGFETQLFLPVVEKRSHSGDRTRTDSDRSVMRPRLSRMSVHMAEHGRGFDPNDDLMRSAEVLLSAIRQGRLLPVDSQKSTSDPVVSGNRQISSGMEALLMGKFDNPWLGILALHGLLLSGEQYRELGQGVLSRMKGLISDHPDLRAVELGLEPAAPVTAPIPFPPMLRAGLELVQERSIRDALIVPADSLTAQAIEYKTSGGAWSAWHNAPEPDRSRVDADSVQSQDEAFMLAARPEWVGTTFSASLEQRPFVRAAAQVTFDMPTMPEVRVDQSDARSAMAEAIVPTTMQEISRQIGLPLARTQQIVQRLQTEPERLDQPLSRGEQEVVESALGVFRRTRLQDPNWTQERRAAETPLDQVYTRLVKYAQDLERAPASLRREGTIDIAERVRLLARTILQRDDLTVVTNLSGDIRSVNRALLVFAGFEPDGFSTFWQSDYPEQLGATLASVAGAPQISIPRRSGDEVLCEIRWMPVIDEQSSTQLGGAFTIRTPEPPPLLPEERERVRRLTSELGLYIPLLIHADASQSTRYLDSITRILNQLASIDIV